MNLGLVFSDVTEAGYARKENRLRKEEEPYENVRESF